MSADAFHVPLIIRGEVIDTAEVSHGGRGGAVSFTSPDVRQHLNRLEAAPHRLSDLYRIGFDEILDYLEALGQRLVLSKNPWLEQAFDLSCRTSGLGADILRNMYETLGKRLSRTSMKELAEKAVGIPYLEGWVESRLQDGSIARVRAFGARAVHIVAGNAPGVSMMTIARNALIRGDAIIKTPSNDPLTAAAIARTMIDMAPDHPLTKHLSVAYWKGGDDTVEASLYKSSNIEKIVAWGGMASISHIAKYIRPGVELVALDPKLSSSIIGREAFDDDATMKKVAKLLAMDGGGMNQEACTNARVVYVHCGTDDDALEKLNRFGRMVYDAVQALPAEISGPAVRLEPKLEEEIEALKLGGEEWYNVIGGGPRGAVIVSQLDDPVDFATLLANRVINLVPVDDIEEPVRAVTNYTQTIGIYPESLKRELRDRLALHGAQRLVSLGKALDLPNIGIQDAIEPVRRMCRWIVDEEAGR